MLKHPSLTTRRIANFIAHDLQPAIVTRLAELTVEFCPEPHLDEATAREKGPWQPVGAGMTWGPAYRMVWFRLKGEVPAWEGELGLQPIVGIERTLWRENQPVIGLDWAHGTAPLSEPIAEFAPWVGEPGETFEVYVQTHARNPQANSYPPLPREAEPERVEGAWFVAVDRELQQLLFDVEFGASLLQGLDERSQAHATVLRALNAVANTYSASRRETIARCRKMLRDAFAGLDAELDHAVVPVGHAHLDTAWLWPLGITHLKMAHTAASQLALMERYPEYVFVHSQASQYEWVEREYPQLFERIRQAAQRGQWEPVGSMWVEADCNLAGGEALVRQFLYGRRYFEQKFGAVSSTVWIPDVFGYPASLPQIFRKSGMDTFLTQKMSWSQFNRFPHHTFWWQGIDGSRVWTHFPPTDTYVGSGEPAELLRGVQKHGEHARSDASLYVFGFGDGGGGPTERHIELLRRARQAGALPDVQMGKRAADFFTEAPRQSRDLAVWNGELYLEYHRGTLTSQAAVKRANRECEFLLRDAELLCCFRDDFPDQYPAERLERNWKIVLLNQFHDILPGSSVVEVYEEAARDYAEVRQDLSALIAESLARIGGKLNSHGFKRPYALFQNATVSTQGAIPWTEAEAPQALRTTDGATGVQLVEEFGERKLLFATPAAALGRVAIGNLVDEPASERPRLKARERRLESGEWQVRFDSHGNITSITSLEDPATDFIEPGALANMFQLFDDKPLFWDAWDIDAFTLETAVNLVRSESFEVVERGPVRVAVELVKRFGNSTLRQRISLGPTPGIRFDTWIDWQETHKMLKVAFPIQVNAARATYEIQFGAVERPTHANTSWDMARFEVCAHKWADVAENGHGVALLNDGKYGHDCRDNVMRLTLLRSPKTPDETCDMGIHRFTYVLLPHFDGYYQADVVAAAYALNSPLRSAPLEATAGVSEDLPRFVSCGSRHVVIESVKKAEDSTRLIVRLFEAHNTRGSAELSCLRSIKRAWLTDLMENPIATLDVTDGLVQFEYKPYEILTFMLEV